LPGSSFEVTANVMTMACITPKRNHLASGFSFPNGDRVWYKSSKDSSR